MIDVFSKEKRSEIMSRIRSKNTKPEIYVRSTLHRKGYRFRIHHNLLPGRPDLVLKKHNAVIFVNGCFWHGHLCKKFKLPKSNKRFWMNKIENNKKRDRTNKIKLKKLGWKVFIVWECKLEYGIKKILKIL